MPDAANIERVLMMGDLSKLTPDQRVSYYNATCKSLGLNPLTRPFDYIVLNGKMTLYAKRDCTEQLRKIHGVSITALDPKMVGELFVVVASAQDSQGRVDQSTGAVNIAGLKGEGLANAMMKAETKAKRRVTLSLCGLGLLDETEVSTLKEMGAASEESEPNRNAAPVGAVRRRSEKTAQPVTETPREAQAQAVGQSTPSEGRVIPPESSDKELPGCINEKQQKLVWIVARSAKMSPQELHLLYKETFGIEHTKQIPKDRMNELLDKLDPDCKFHTNNNRSAEPAEKDEDF